MTYVVLKGYLYDPIWSDRLRKARGSNGTGESIQKRQFYFYYISIRLVLVSDLGSVSPFFRDELLAPVLHFVSVDRGERELGGRRIVTWEKQGGQPLSNIQHGFWQCNVVGLSCRSEWIILSTEVNLCLLGKRIASYKFCLGRTCISITMKFINEVVNGGVTIILFVVTNLVCVPKKRNLSIFRGLEGAWKHIRTLELKWKNRCNSSYFGNGKIFGARRRGWSVSSWLGSDFSIFLRIPSRVLLLPVSNRTCWAKSSSCKTCFI